MQQNIVFKRKLIIPQELKEMYPISRKAAEAKAQNDAAVKAVLEGRDRRLLIIIGPCSADREDAVMDYLLRLRTLQEEVKDKLLFIPRLYTNKSRTSTASYKGMLHQPDPRAASDMLQGLISIRKLHIKAIEQSAFSCADEMLYPENHKYLSDLLSYTTVGARSVENQQHRLTASGLDIAVGMKNPTGGNLPILLNAIKAAQSPQTFIYRNWEVESKGNSLAHAILRGYIDVDGNNHSNYDTQTLMQLCSLMAENNISNPSIIVDTNHCNSSKHYLEQIPIAKEVIKSIKEDSTIASVLKGLMVESYIEDGCQSANESVYGKSITDPCLGWDKTKRLIYDIAESL